MKVLVVEEQIFKSTSSMKMDMNLNKLWEIVEDRETGHAAVHGVTQSWTQLNINTREHLKLSFLGSSKIVSHCR